MLFSCFLVFLFHVFLLVDVISVEAELSGGLRHSILVSCFFVGRLISIGRMLMSCQEDCVILFLFPVLILVCFLFLVSCFLYLEACRRKLESRGLRVAIEEQYK